jgi:hypothetical protein
MVISEKISIKKLPRVGEKFQHFPACRGQHVEIRSNFNGRPFGPDCRIDRQSGAKKARILIAKYAGLK